MLYHCVIYDVRVTIGSSKQKCLFIVTVVDRWHLYSH